MQYHSFLLINLLSLSRNVTSKWCSVSLLVNGKKETIVSTPGHKYYLPFNNVNRDINEVLEHESYKGLSNKWVSAKDLKCGDKVLLSNGSYGIIESAIVEELQKEEITYNFEVEDFHTYFVGEDEVCVHNHCKLGRNMKKIGIEPESGDDAHHIFPQKFRKEFNSLGIDIDDASNGIWINQGAHRSGARYYNALWEKAFNEGIVASDNAADLAKEFMKLAYGR